MRISRTIATIWTSITLLSCGMAQTLIAQDVDVQLSNREAFVGMPVVLQITINNATDYQQPAEPQIDGCDVRSAGVPAQSSQITIINGRRSESRSVTMQYLITPRRAGTFEIPAMTVNIDGRDRKTRPLRFVATKSETGDLLFVEIEGSRDKVFVGQPLDLTLKIWIKPFVDREKNIKLSEANMWQMISEQTSWGSFADRLRELAENNQRPGGDEVLRDDGLGNERSYYLYEIHATVYPRRPGKIDADDVQIVINYPTALGQSRDPFEDFFRDSPFGRDPFGGNSPLSRMMSDDFFSSPFSNRLTVSSARPIVAGAEVDATEVIPVPAEGRPADYQGAVGRYQIATQATPTRVKAGDPITLKIGIAGTGPMDLVQAPPLASLPSLTANFQVADQSLAGFVQGDKKVFSTTIRPRQEGIAEIPSIPFSFFDPDRGAFETVMSEPISVTVDKSESLDLGAVVGAPRGNDGPQAATAMTARPAGPDFSNSSSANLLVSQTAPATTRWWLPFVLAPPLVWLATLVIGQRRVLTRWIPNLKSPKTRCLSAIDRAENRGQVDAALVHYVGARTGSACSTPTESLGALRTAGLQPLANEIEIFFQSRAAIPFAVSGGPSLADVQQTARELTDRIDSTFASLNKSLVRRSKKRGGRRAAERTDGETAGTLSAISRKVSPILIVGLLVGPLAGKALAEQGVIPSPSVTVDGRQDPVLLNDAQRQTILQEAGAMYDQAQALAGSDTAEANDLFSTAADKYQLLVDSGIRNGGLYLNLGNAYLKSNQLGRAIVNYERAEMLDPANRQIQANLKFADSLVKGQSANPVGLGEATGSRTSLGSIINGLRRANESLTAVTGGQWIAGVLVVSSLLFWGLLTAAAMGYRFPLKRLAIVPLLLLIVSGTSCALEANGRSGNLNGVIVTNDVHFRAGDGEQFDDVVFLESAQGQRVQILNQRSNWRQVRTATGQTGWIPAADVESLW